jgi:hypothetical protein
MARGDRSRGLGSPFCREAGGRCGIQGSRSYRAVEVVNFRTPLFIAVIVWLLFMSVTNTHPDTRADLAFIRSSRDEQGPKGNSDKFRLDLKDRTDELEMAGLTALRLYQVLLSSQDGPRCTSATSTDPPYPSDALNACALNTGLGALIITAMKHEYYLEAALLFLYPFRRYYPAVKACRGEKSSLKWDAGRMGRRFLSTPYQLPRCLKRGLACLDNSL